MAKGKGDTVTFRLTPLQREALLHRTRLRRPVRQRLEASGGGAVTVTQEELDALTVEVGEAALYATGPDKARLLAVLRKLTGLAAPADAGTLAVARSAARSGETSGAAYQFKITLLDIKPPVWRRVQVPDGTLGDLHHVIQAAFGWEDCHLHQFEIGGRLYGPPDPGGFGLPVKNEDKFKLSALLPPAGQKARWVYEYDFGDGWRHEILFEGVPPAEPDATYPRCVKGARACPPEDCGGPWGYAEYLAALADPGHERHEELRDWRGPFDPEAFDPDRATAEMRRVT